jgi:hypothetical protein
MPLSWNEIRDHAIAFPNAWDDAANERAEAQTFWNEFFEVFGIPRRRGCGNSSNRACARSTRWPTGSTIAESRA